MITTDPAPVAVTRATLTAAVEVARARFEAAHRRLQRASVVAITPAVLTAETAPKGCPATVWEVVVATRLAYEVAAETLREYEARNRRGNNRNGGTRPWAR
jgi:hypothetical protein